VPRRSWNIAGGAAWTVILGLLAVTWLAGCTSSGAPSPETTAANMADIDVILVAPFESLLRGEAGTMNRCPICNAVLDTGRVEPGADRFMTRQLMARMKAMSAYTLLDPGIASGVRARIISEDIGISLKRLLVEMGKESGADAVLSGVVYRFRQRVGTSLSVQTPASVGFGVHLIRCADGALLWTDHFDETQQNLSENLLKLRSFVERGGRWLTVEELAARGLAEVMSAFPGRK